MYIGPYGHTSQKKEGLEYLKILEGRDDGFPNKGLNTVLISDAVGNPIKKI